MHLSSPFSVNLDQMFGSSLLANLVCIISSCVVATQPFGSSLLANLVCIISLCEVDNSKRLCVRIKFCEASIALKDSFSFLGSLVI